jgi:hypothetical protein
MARDLLGGVVTLPPCSRSSCRLAVDPGRRLGSRPGLRGLHRAIHRNTPARRVSARKRDGGLEVKEGIGTRLGPERNVAGGQRVRLKGKVGSVEHDASL